MSHLADDANPYWDQKFTDSAGPVGDHINTVFGPIFWVSVVVFVGVSLAILYNAFRFRRKSDDEEPEQIHGNNRLELAWTIIPFTILITLFVVTFVNMQYVNSRPAGVKALNVCVEGQQFNWNYIYEDDCRRVPGPVVNYIPARGSGVVKDLNELVVPTGEPIQLHLVSVDVNHSFFIPEVAGQVNAIPGQDNELWFQIDRPGTYHGACTELCGSNHYSMLVRIVAKSPADWNAWYAQQQAKDKGAS